MIEPAASGYLEYMAERPRSHGLFAADGAADLEQTMEEINAHAGPVWTFVYSLKREDAARLGYENGDSWRRLLLAHQTELATAMKIPPSSFRWCAAFHDEKHHPHIHMMAWSNDPKQGYLTERGIEQMRSQLSNDIFQDELLSLYQQKDISYQEVRDTAMEAMGRLIREMKSGLCDSPVIAEQVEMLSVMLSEVKGKKGVRLFEKASMKTQRKKKRNRCKCWSSSGVQVSPLLRISWASAGGMALAFFRMTKKRSCGFNVARKLVMTSPSMRWASCCKVRRESTEAVSWYEKAVELGDPYAAYQLGKLYLQGEQVQKDVAKALEYLTQSAEQGNQYAQYTLGKLYLTGEEVAQDQEQAYNWLWESASQGNEYAQFLLDHFDDSHRPNVLLAVTSLLHHMGRIFQDNSVPPAVPTGQQMDRKLRRKIQEKKIAMGHKPDDHEEEQTMGGMTMG